VGCQCLTPIILAIQEAEIRRIMVPSQPVLQDLISKKSFTKVGLVEWLKVKKEIKEDYRK
jgi:hypothetical protein